MSAVMENARMGAGGLPMIEYEEQEVTVEGVTAIVCDVCGTRFTDCMDIQEIHIVEFRGGYASVFGDMNHIKCCICPDCLYERIEDYCYIKIDEGGDKWLKYTDYIKSNGGEPCRVVKDGKITDERWGSHNGGMKHFWIILTILIAFTLACSWGLAQTLVSIFPQLAG